LLLEQNNILKTNCKEGNLERWAARAGEIGEMNRGDGDEREKSPEEEDQKKVEKNREKEKQGWEK
jgi:hypothetical protein